MPCGCGGSSASWACSEYGESLALGHVVGVGLCRGVHGSCCGVCVVVMSWVWWVIGFGSCCGFYFCGCRLIFLGSCGLILVVVVVGCVKWCLISGCHFFFKYLFIFI